ncbi:hypothetical protein ACYOEI_01605 [Singulisphaera rosea]
MVRSVGSLFLGRRYRPELVYGVLEAWHGHYSGRRRTSLGAGMAEVVDVI